MPRSLARSKRSAATTSRSCDVGLGPNFGAMRASGLPDPSLGVRSAFDEHSPSGIRVPRSFLEPSIHAAFAERRRSAAGAGFGRISGCWRNASPEDGPNAYPSWCAAAKCWFRSSWPQRSSLIRFVGSDDGAGWMRVPTSGGGDATATSCSRARRATLLVPASRVRPATLEARPVRRSDRVIDRGGGRAVVQKAVAPQTRAQRRLERSASTDGFLMSTRALGVPPLSYRPTRKRQCSECRRGSAQRGSGCLSEKPNGYARPAGTMLARSAAAGGCVRPAASIASRTIRSASGSGSQPQGQVPWGPCAAATCR